MMCMLNVRQKIKSEKHKSRASREYEKNKVRTYIKAIFYIV
jgi:hypothetical protein